MAQYIDLRRNHHRPVDHLVDIQLVDELMQCVALRCALVEANPEERK